MTTDEKSKALFSVLGNLEEPTKDGVYTEEAKAKNVKLYNEFLEKSNIVVEKMREEEAKAKARNAYQVGRDYAKNRYNTDVLSYNSGVKFVDTFPAGVSKAYILKQAKINLEMQQDLEAMQGITIAPTPSVPLVPSFKLNTVDNISDTIRKDVLKEIDQSILQVYQNAFDTTNNANMSRRINETVINEQLEAIAKENLEKATIRRRQEVDEQKAILLQQQMRNQQFSSSQNTAIGGTWNPPAGFNRNNNSSTQASVPLIGKVYRCSRPNGGSLKACQADGSIQFGECYDKSCKYYMAGDLDKEVITMADGKTLIRKNVEGKGVVYEEDDSLKVVEHLSATKKRKFGFDD